MATVPELGDLPTEADKLLTVLAERLAVWRDQQAGRRPANPGPVAEAGEPEPTGAPDAPPAAAHVHPEPAAVPCTSCPWCRLQVAWQQQRPEVTAALLEAASLAVTALQTVLHSPPSGSENAGSDHHPAGSPPPAQGASSDAVRPGAEPDPGPDHASTDPEETTPVPAAADGITLQRIPIR